MLATADSPLQFSALVRELEKSLREQGAERRHHEGSRDNGWALIDFGDIVVHVFTPELRAFYRLEELWGRTSPVVRFSG